MNAMVSNRLIRGDGVLPARVEQMLRQIKLDSFTGNIILNIKNGQVRGFHKTEFIDLPEAEF